MSKVLNRAGIRNIGPGIFTFRMVCLAGLFSLFAAPETSAQVTITSIEMQVVTTGSAFCGGGTMLTADLRFRGSTVSSGDALNWTIRRVNRSQQSGPFDIARANVGADIDKLLVTTVATVGMSPLQNGDIVEIFAFWDDNPNVESAHVFVVCSGTGNPAVYASLQDALLNDRNGNNQVDPGDNGQFDLLIANGGATCATAASLSLALDANVAVVPGSIRTTPLARDDSYTAIGNVVLQVSAPGLLGNDNDPDGQPGLQIVSVTGGTSTHGGELVIMANGAFNYHPPRGFEGRDSFVYFLEDADGNRDQGRVQIDVSDMVWFIDNAAASNGDGRFTTPFNTLAAFNSAQGGGSDHPGAGDIIFLHSGSGAYDGGLTLLNGQRVVGQGADLEIQGQTITSAGQRPVLTNSVGVGLQLAFNNDVRGFDIKGPAGDGIKGSAFGSFTSASLSVRNAAGAALNLENGSLNASFATLVSRNSSGQGMSLRSLGGQLEVTIATIISGAQTEGVDIRDCGAASLAFASTSILAAGRDALNIQSSAGTSITFASTSIMAAGRDGINIQSSAGAWITFASLSITTANGRGIVANDGGSLCVGASNNSIIAIGGAAIDLSGTNIVCTLATLSSLNSSGEGSRFSNSGGIFCARGGSIVNAAGTAFNVLQGNGILEFGGSINNGSGRAVSITNRSGGSVTLSGSVTDNGPGNTGILIQNNNSGNPSITLSGEIDIVNSAGTAITLSNNSGADLRLHSPGIDNAVSNQAGIVASGGGTLTTTGGSITTGTASAIDIDGMALNVTLQSVSSVGGSSVGIDLTNNTGSFSVNGDGASANNGSGGIVANKSGNGVVLSNSSNVAFRYMNIDNCSLNGISGSGVNGFILHRCNVRNHGNSSSTAPLLFSNLSGTVSTGANPTVWSDNIIFGGDEDNVQIKNDSGTLAELLVTSCTIGSMSNFNDNDGINIEGLSSGPANADIALVVSDCTFLGNGGDHIGPFHNGANGRLDVVIRNNSMSGSSGNPQGVGGGITIAANNGADCSYEVEGNTITGVVLVGIDANLGISAAATEMTGTINDNTIGTAGVGGSGSSQGVCIRVRGNRAGTHTTAITNNTMRQWSNGGGITAQWRDGSPGGTLNVTITGNSQSDPGAFGYGLHLEAGAAAGDDGTICAVVGGAGALQNTFATNAGAFSEDIQIHQNFNTTFNLPGYTGAATNPQARTDLASYFAGRNVGTPTVCSDPSHGPYFCGDINVGITGLVCQ